MRPASRLLSLSLLALLATSCRDEQAGPKPRAKALPPPTQARVLEAAPADLTYRSGATLGGGAVRYLGTRVTPQGAQPGQSVQLSHYFEAL
ncbi:MAG TPA: hypothetical protein VF697_02585, partial [Archangium sp.]